MDDVLHTLAQRAARLERQVMDSAEIEVQFTRGVKGDRPILAMIAKAHDAAAVAMAALVVVDAEDAKKVRALQNEVLRFEAMVIWIKNIVSEGKQADRELISDARREEVLNHYVAPADVDEAAMYAADQQDRDDGGQE